MALAGGRLHHDGAVQTGLLLEARVRLVPVGAALLHQEAAGEGFARRDAGETDARHAVHAERQQDAVPVGRGGQAQPVGHAQGHRSVLFPARDRAGHLAVDGGGRAGGAGEVDRRLADLQLKVGAAQHVRVCGTPRAGGAIDGPGARRAQQPQARCRAAQHDTLHEAPPRGVGVVRTNDFHALLHRGHAQTCQSRLASAIADGRRSWMPRFRSVENSGDWRSQRRRRMQRRRQRVAVVDIGGREGD